MMVIMVFLNNKALQDDSIVLTKMKVETIDDNDRRLQDKKCGSPSIVWCDDSRKMSMISPSEVSKIDCVVSIELFLQKSDHLGKIIIADFSNWTILDGLDYQLR